MTTTHTETLILDRLADAAKLSKRSGILSYKTGAVIYSHLGLEISRGWSHYSVFTFAQYRSIHAELHAVLRSSLKSRLKGSTVYVATTSSKSGNKTLSKPCSLCMALIYEAGLAHAVYTTGHDSYEVINLG